MHRQISSNRLVFGAGLTITLAAAGYTVLGFSYANYFLPGYNDRDASTGVEVLHWLTAVLSTFGAVGVFYKIRQNVLAATEDRVAGVVQARTRSGSIYSTMKDEGIGLLETRGNCSNTLKKIGLFTLGSLTSLALVATFLFIAKHDAEEHHEFSNHNLTIGLIGATVGVAVLFVLTAGILFCAGRQQKAGSTQGCWARLTSCCGTASNSDEPTYRVYTPDGGPV